MVAGCILNRTRESKMKILGQNLPAWRLLKMRHAMGAIPFLLAIGALPALAQTLPASCGAVGASSYTPPAVSIPAVVLNRGTVITVTNATVAINGDTSSVAALVANPGPDGISLPEAVMATNNDPGTWIIQFAPSLKGSIIHLDPAPSVGFLGLPFLTGGNVTINGDISGDGQPDITLTTSQSGNTVGIYVISGGNTLYGLALQNFWQGVWIGPQPAAAATTFSNITIGNLVMTNIQQTAIGVDLPSPFSASTQIFDHVLITGNTISGNVAGPVLGIGLDLGSTAGATLQHITVANNNIVLPMPGAASVGGIAMNIGAGIGAMNNQALDALIANNAISENPGSFGIRISAGGGGASASLIDGVQVIANQIGLINPTGVIDLNVPANGFGTGIIVIVGDAASDDQYPSLLPIQYSENNIARNISVLSNTIGEADGFGISVSGACCGNGNNTIDNLSILGNTILANVVAGVQLVGGASGGYYSRPSTGNMLSNVLVQANTIHSSPLPPSPFPPTLEQEISEGGGIFVIAGLAEPGNSVNGISIANNDVNTQLIGINIVGGWGVTQGPANPPSPANSNVVAHPQIFCNQIDQLPTNGLATPSGVNGITVTAGLDAASGNLVQQVRVENNLIAGALSDASFFANLGDGASGNTMSISKVSVPGSCDPRISPMLWTTCRSTPPGRGR